MVDSGEQGRDRNTNKSTYEELGEVVDAQRVEQEKQQRLRVVEGLSEVKTGVISLGKAYRLMVTAAVQAAPSELGVWLHGNGQGFRASERPVNTSLIDQEHNWTFAGENGFIIFPPTDGDDIIAAKPQDIGSNDLEKQPIEFDSAELLAKTDPMGYNQINIAAGGLLGIYIRQDEAGNDLGNPRVNEGLRKFAQKSELPVVEILVPAQEFKSGLAGIKELDAKPGNRLWKIRVPGDDLMQEVDVIKLKPGEFPRGMRVDENGFDLRIQEIDRYGRSRYINGREEALMGLRQKIEQLFEIGTEEGANDALRFALKRIDEMITAD